MKRRAWMAIIGAAFVALAQPIPGQGTLHWRAYKLADGLADAACVSLSISPQGIVLAKHLNTPAVSELDGYSVKIRPCPEGSSRVYESPSGQLWTVSARGLEEL